MKQTPKNMKLLITYQYIQYLVNVLEVSIPVCHEILFAWK